MKFLLDQGIARSAIEHLASRGHDTIHVLDIGMDQADDDDIIARAGADGRIVVTLDADFHATIALSGATRPSVIRIRIEGLRGKEVAAVVQSAVDRFTTDLDAGCLVSVEEHVIRRRMLPIQPTRQRP